MVSKYIQYFLNENNLELGEEFIIVYENGSEVHKDEKTFFFKTAPVGTNDILICKQDVKFYTTAVLLNLLTGLYCVKKKPWQPEIGDVYFYVAIDDKGEGIIHAETLFDKNDIKFLLLKKAKKYYRTYLEAKKHLKTDYDDLKGE